MDRDTFLGGSPIAVIVRLALLSLIVGIVLSALGITPANLFYRLNLIFGRLYELGFKSVEWALGYLILGAIVVVPIWLAARVFSAARRSNDEKK